MSFLNKAFIAGALLFSATEVDARGRAGNKASQQRSRRRLPGLTEAGGTSGLAGGNMGRLASMFADELGSNGGYSADGSRGGAFHGRDRSGSDDDERRPRRRRHHHRHRRHAAMTLKAIDACEDEILEYCPPEGFDLDTLKEALEAFQEAKDNAIAIFKETGELPELDNFKPSEEMIEELKAMRSCLRDEVKEALEDLVEGSLETEDDGTCLSVLSEGGAKRPRRGAAHVSRALEAIKACESDIVMSCSLDFDFDLDALKDTLETFLEVKEEAIAIFKETGEKPDLDNYKPSEETLENLKAVRSCVHDVVKETLEEGSTCLAAITPPGRPAAGHTYGGYIRPPRPADSTDEDEGSEEAMPPLEDIDLVVGGK